MATKVKDLVVSTGTYTDSSGQQKHRYINIGGVFKNDDGSVFMLVGRHINLAGLPFKEGGDSVLINVFDLRDPNATQGQASTRQTRRAPVAAPAAAATTVDDSDIPF